MSYSLSKLLVFPTITPNASLYDPLQGVETTAQIGLRFHFPVIVGKERHGTEHG